MSILHQETASVLLRPSTLLNSDLAKTEFIPSQGPTDLLYSTHPETHRQTHPRPPTTHTVRNYSSPAATPHAF